MLTVMWIAIGLGAITASSVIPLVGLWRFLSVALLLSLAIAPYPLFLLPDAAPHFGVTFPDYVPMTYSVVLALMGVGTLRSQGIRPILAMGIPLVGYLALLTYFQWGSTSAQWAGVAHLSTALIAVATGWAIAQSLRGDPKLRGLWVSALLGIVIVQLVVCAAQLVGVGVSVYDEVHYFMAESRPIGTFNHPSVLGKVLFVLAIPLLPLTRSGAAWTRYVAWASLVLMIPLTAFTQSRANTIAIASVIFLWVLLDRRIGKKRRALYFAGTLVASIPLAVLLAPRFLLDPDGGARTELLATGLDQISKSPWFGIGPNSYSQVVGEHDFLAASGFPVHNALLLVIAEIGVLGAVLLCVPIVIQLTMAISRFRAPGLQGDAALSVLVSVPGLLLINLTGWGFLSGGSFILWALAIGLSLGFMAKGRTQNHVLHFPNTGSYRRYSRSSEGLGV